MNYKALAISLPAALLLSTGVNADDMESDSYAYLGAGYAIQNFTDNSFHGDGELDGLLLLGGLKLDENLAVEIRFGSGVKNDLVNGAKLQLKDQLGAYLKWGAPTNSGLYPYLMVGATHAVFKVENNSMSRTDFSYGCGISYPIADNIATSLDYSKYIDTGGSELGGWMLGMKFRF